MIPLFESFTSKLVENVVSAYSSKVEGMAEARGAELASVKSKIRTDPEEVEAWFDTEIEKLKSINLGELLRKTGV